MRVIALFHVGERHRDHISKKRATFKNRCEAIEFPTSSSFNRTLENSPRNIAELVTLDRIAAMCADTKARKDFKLKNRGTVLGGWVGNNSSLGVLATAHANVSLALRQDVFLLLCSRNNFLLFRLGRDEGKGTWSCFYYLHRFRISIAKKNNSTTKVAQDQMEGADRETKAQKIMESCGAPELIRTLATPLTKL